MLLGARQSLWRGGRLSAKSYVQDGLIAQWDGIENAGYGVHRKSLSRWKGLRSEFEDMVFNNPDGIAVHDSSVEIIDPATTLGKCDTDILPLIETGNFSIEIRSRQTEDKITERNNTTLISCIDDPYKSSHRLLCLDPRNDTGGLQYYSDGWNNGNRVPVTIGYRSPHTFTLFPVENSISLSVDTDNVVTLPKRDLVPTGIYNPYLNGYYLTDMDGTSKAYAKMEWSSVRIYNRTLTPEEIAWNYQIDKERFGI